MAVGSVPVETPAIIIYAPTERARANAARRKWRLALVGGCIGTVCCALTLASVLRGGGYVGSNGRAATEPTDLLAIFKAPEMQLAGLPSPLSRKQHALAGLTSRVIQLDSVKPLLDGVGTQNVAEAVAALQRHGGEKSTLTLRGVPTEVTITLPEDVTISRVAALSGVGKTTKLNEGSDFWAYGGAVMPPKDWGNDWKTCREGTRQSPIDIAPAEVRGDSALPPLEWKCGGKPCVGEEPFNASAPSPSKADILYDGHTLQMSNFEADGSPALEWQGKQYTLSKIQVHTPSEHTVDEAYYDMELQLEHEGPAGHRLVVAVLWSTGEGIRSPGWVDDMAGVIRPCHLDADHCRLSDSPEHLTTAWSFQAVAGTLGPLLEQYYSYNGSLTQPPCTEGVTWVVGKRYGRMSQTDWTNVAALEGKNNRPRQQRAHRVVKLKP